jgi:catechol 2,3-dioxygenase-like lactoylglutathione lyase family enzyme
MRFGLYRIGCGEERCVSKLKLGHVTVLVKDYDEALDFYVKKLGFEKRADNPMGKDYRWVTVAPLGQKEIAIVFVLADTREKQARVGSQVANHVFFVLETDDCEGDYRAMKARGVRFFGEPKEMPWGKEVVFEDLYGNRFDLLQINTAAVP